MNIVKTAHEVELLKQELNSIRQRSIELTRKGDVMGVAKLTEPTRQLVQKIKSSEEYLRHQEEVNQNPLNIRSLSFA